MVMDVKIAFSELLVALCDRKKLNAWGRQAAIVKYFKANGVTITQPAVKKWFDATAMPDQVKAVWLARFLNCDVSDLLNGDKKALDKEPKLDKQPEPIAHPAWPFADKITPKQYDSLSPKQKEMIIGRILTFLDDNDMKSKRGKAPIKATN